MGLIIFFISLAVAGLLLANLDKLFFWGRNCPKEQPTLPPVEGQYIAREDTLVADGNIHQYQPTLHKVDGRTVFKKDSTFFIKEGQNLFRKLTDSEKYQCGLFLNSNY